MTVHSYDLFVVKPLAGVNYFPNPSIEKSMDWIGWNNGTPTQSQSQVKFGFYSLAIEPDPLTLSSGAYTNIAELEASTQYCLSFYAWGTKGYQYNAYVLDIINGSSPGYINFEGAGIWKRYSFTFTTTGAANLHQLFIRDLELHSAILFIDGLQLEKNRTTPTTYFDGSMEGFLNPKKVLEYWWESTPHASNSYRAAITNSGGELEALVLGCKKLDVYGLGMAPVSNVAIPLVTGGERYLYSKGNARFFAAQIVLSADMSMGEISEERERIRQLVDPLSRQYAQPILLKYIGYDSDGEVATEFVDIKCQYISGLDRASQTVLPDFIDVVFRMSDVYMKIEGTRSEYLQYVDTLGSLKYIIGRKSQGTWFAFGTGATGEIATICPDARVANKFHLAGVVTAFNGVAGSVFTIDEAANPVSLGNGLNNVVHKMRIRKSDNSLWAVGTFTLSGATTVRRVGYWSGTAWVEYAGGISSGTIEAIVWDSNNVLYVGGTTGVYRNVGGAMTLYGATALVASLAVTNDDVLLRGTYANTIEYYNGSAWAIGLAAGGARLAVYGNYVYAGSMYQGAATSGVIKKINLNSWVVEKTWLVAGTGVPGCGFTGAQVIDDEIWMYGNFQSVEGVDWPDGVVIIKNDTLFQLEANLPGSAIIRDVAKNANGTLAIVFSTTGTATIAATNTMTIDCDRGYPIFEITGPGDVYQIKNFSNGKTINFSNLTLASGEIMTLDLRPNKNTLVTTSKGDARGYISVGSNLDLFLSRGENIIQIFVDNYTYPTTNTILKYEPLLLSVDGAA